MHSACDDPCGPGFPIRTSSDHSSVASSLKLFAGSHVLHRLPTPRHPPCALGGSIVPARRRYEPARAEVTRRPPSINDRIGRLSVAADSTPSARNTSVCCARRFGATSTCHHVDGLSSVSGCQGTCRVSGLPDFGGFYRSFGRCWSLISAGWPGLRRGGKRRHRPKRVKRLFRLERCDLPRKLRFVIGAKWGRIPLGSSLRLNRRGICGRLAPVLARKSGIFVT